MSTNETNKNNNSEINIKDLFFYLLSKWKWFLLSLVVCGSIAWYKYAKTQFVYFRQATVIIKDPSNKTSTAGLDRYDNYINKVNVANEILQFQSKKLMAEVVKRVHADISYLHINGLRLDELYVKAPVCIRFPDATPESYISFKLNIKNNKQVVISDIYGMDEDKTFIVNMNDTVKVNGFHMVVTPTNYFSESWDGEGIRVKKLPISSMVSYYLANFGIKQAEDEASILKLSLRDSSPTRAEDVLNTLITVYNEDAIKDKNQVAVNTADFINERLIIISKELGGVESELESFKRSNKIIDIGSTTSRYMSQSEQSNSEAFQLETQLRMAQYIKEYLEKSSNDNSLIPSNTGIGNPSIEAQISQYNNIKLRLDKLIDDSSDKNPVVEELNNSLHAMKQSIIRAVDNMIVSINVQRKDAMSREQRAWNQVSAIPKKERTMLSIERQQKIKETLYLFLLNRREENALSQAMADNNARVIDAAAGSSSPLEPDRNRIMILGLLIGFVLPTVVFLFRLFMDTYVHSRRDLKGKVSVPILGEVPLDKELMKKKTSEREVVISSDEDDIVSEAFRILRTNMTFMHQKDKKCQVITFTSFSEGAGKTFISRNLAMSFIFAKKRVLLLDMDIRKGTLSRQFKKHHIGLTNYLSDDTISVDDIIHRVDEVENLDIISAGPVPPNPAELLMSDRLDELVNAMRDRYDYIIADNVPVGIIADATIANRIADLTIFVVRAGKLDKRQLPDIESLYQEKKLNNLTLVLNGVDMSHHGYGYGYGYSYGYTRYGYGHYGYGYGYGHSKSKKKPS